MLPKELSHLAFYYILFSQNFHELLVLLAVAIPFLFPLRGPLASLWSRNNFLLYSPSKVNPYLVQSAYFF